MGTFQSQSFSLLSHMLYAFFEQSKFFSAIWQPSVTLQMLLHTIETVRVNVD